MSEHARVREPGSGPDRTAELQRRPQASRGRGERVLLLQHAAGNRAVTGLLAGRLPVQRERIGLAADKSTSTYAKAISDGEASFAGLDPKARITALMAPANDALATAGVPRVIGIEDPLGRMAGTAEHAAFNRGLWQVWFNPDFLRGNLTREQFGRCANTAYHECRHAEQTFLVARRLAAERKSADQICRLLGVGKNIAEGALQRPLDQKKNKAEWELVGHWQANMISDPGPSLADVVNEQMAQAFAKYWVAKWERGRWQLAQDNDPRADPAQRAYFFDALNKPGGARRMKDHTDELEKTFVRAWELAKQCYLQYAKMPVEQDAWAVGGEIERQLGLPPHTAEAELRNLGDNPRVMNPIDRLSPLERQLATAMKNQLQ